MVYGNNIIYFEKICYCEILKGTKVQKKYAKRVKSVFKKKNANSCYDILENTFSLFFKFCTLFL